MKSPKVSVVMPVYNGEPYLREAIESILNQTYTDLELIIINDGSTDNSEEIILSYKDPRIVYVKNPSNLQIVKTLNKGISLSRGDYIARMDSDDISLPTRFEKQIKFLENNSDITICGSNIRRLRNNLKWKSKKFPPTNDDIRATLLFECPLAHPTVVIRRNFFDTLKYNHSFNMAEDYALWCDAALLNYKFHNIQENLLLYRLHSNQTAKPKQNIIADKVRNKLLKKVNPHATEADFSIQSHVSLFKDHNIKTINEFLIKITEKNKITKFCSEDSMLKIVTRQFWQFCKTQSHKNPQLLFNYHKCTLSKYVQVKPTTYIKFAIRCFLSKNGKKC